MPLTWKWLVLFLKKKLSFKKIRLSFSSKLDTDIVHLGLDIVSIAKTGSKKIGALIRCMKFLFPEVALYLYKFTIQPCVEYCGYSSAWAPYYLLEIG